MGRRASDQYLIPLCRGCHEWVEATGDDESRLTECGIHGREIAKTLWGNRGDRPAMMRVVIRSLNARGVYVA